MRMEFGFDVLEIAKGNYASQAYKDVIGFKVDTAVLSRAFLETYGININDVFRNRYSFAVETFRWVVANIFPVITRAAWASRRSDILKRDSTLTGKNFRYRMRQKQYNKQYGTGYKHPGFFPTAVSLFIRVLPKLGPLRSLKFKTPTAESEKYFIQSFDTISQHYSAHLKQLKSPTLNLKDIDFDTGKPTSLCEYILADQTYDTWLVKLQEDKFRNVSSSLKQNILNFYYWQNETADNRYTKKCKVVFNAYKELKNFNTGR